MNDDNLVEKELSYVVMKAHENINSIENKITAIDCTCGNGHDTLFVAKVFKNVFAFDIQELAIRRSKKRLEKYHNVEFILDNNANIDKYNFDNIDLIIYNLGFLPGSNRKVFTKKDDIIVSIEKAISLLNKHGKILITAYLRHDGGLEEYNTIIDYLIRKSNKIIFTTCSDDLTKDTLIIVTQK